MSVRVESANTTPCCEFDSFSTSFANFLEQDCSVSFAVSASGLTDQLKCWLIVDKMHRCCVQISDGWNKVKRCARCDDRRDETIQTVFVRHKIRKWCAAFWHRNFSAFVKSSETLWSHCVEIGNAGDALGLHRFLCQLKSYVADDDLCAFVEPNIITVRPVLDSSRKRRRTTVEGETSFKNSGRQHCQLKSRWLRDCDECICQVRKLMVKNFDDMPINAGQKFSLSLRNKSIALQRRTDQSKNTKRAVYVPLPKKGILAPAAVRRQFQTNQDEASKRKLFRNSWQK